MVVHTFRLFVKAAIAIFVFDRGYILLMLDSAVHRVTTPVLDLCGFTAQVRLTLAASISWAQDRIVDHFRGVQATSSRKRSAFTDLHFLERISVE